MVVVSAAEYTEIRGHTTPVVVEYAGMTKLLVVPRCDSRGCAWSRWSGGRCISSLPVVSLGAGSGKTLTGTRAQTRTHKHTYVRGVTCVSRTHGRLADPGKTAVPSFAVYTMLINAIGPEKHARVILTRENHTVP